MQQAVMRAQQLAIGCSLKLKSPQGSAHTCRTLCVMDVQGFASQIKVFPMGSSISSTGYGAC